MLKDEPRTMMINAATCYLAAGLCVLPAAPLAKRPTVATWRTYQRHLPEEAELAAWLATAEGVCIVCGAVSGNLEMIDFDLEGSAFEAWADLVRSLSQGLFERLVIESTPSGGFHVVYRCESAVAGNAKLASREFEAGDDTPLTIGTKDYRPVRKANGRWVATVAMVETRGEGGLFLCDPTPGYRVVQGDMARPPVLTAGERETLLRAARSLDEAKPVNTFEAQNQGAIASSTAIVSKSGQTGERPGDAFSRMGDPRPYLEQHGWVRVRTGENEHWRRPGKASGSSATLKDGVFYVFSSNAAPFEPEKGYSPFAVYTLLEHAGDFNAAATALGNAGYGDRPRFHAPGVDLSNFQLPGVSATSTPPPASGMDLTPFFGPEPETPQTGLSPIPVGELVRAYPTLRRPVIHGLLREGETMNIIAAPKVRKSWLSLDLAAAVATGEPWLDRFPTERGDVLIIDNELHRETSAYRIPKVAAGRQLTMAEISERILIDNVRGRLIDINRLGRDLRSIEPGRYALIILDAFYRFMPGGSDENDNAGMAAIYNALDSVANHLRCCFVLIHHSSKGNQAGKSVTDIGAGAGAQSRAADTHLVLRPHEEDGAVVLDAAVRSWPPVSPVCLRWEFPIWTVDDELDPANIEGGKKPNGDRAKSVKTPQMTPIEFVDRFIDDEPTTKKDIEDAAKDQPGLSLRKVRMLISESEKGGLITLVQKPHDGGRGRPQQGYVRTPGSDLWTR